MWLGDPHGVSVIDAYMISRFFSKKYKQTLLQEPVFCCASAQFLPDIRQAESCNLSNLL
jgi:hypothetical protein